MTYPVMGLVTVALMVCVPVYIYRCLRSSYVADGGTTSMSSLWMQGIMVFLCGSLLQGVLAVVYLKWIEPSFIITQLRSVIAFYSSVETPEAQEMSRILQNMIDANLVPTAASMVVEMICLTVFTGSILSMIIGAIVRMRKI